MFETEHPAYPKLQKLGKEITQKVRPKALVVCSAHWQDGKSHVEVNTAEMTELIYEWVLWHHWDVYCCVARAGVCMNPISNRKASKTDPLLVVL